MIICRFRCIWRWQIRGNYFSADSRRISFPIAHRALACQQFVCSSCRFEFDEKQSCADQSGYEFLFHMQMDKILEESMALPLSPENHLSPEMTARRALDLFVADARMNVTLTN